MCCLHFQIGILKIASGNLCKTAYHLQETNVRTSDFKRMCVLFVKAGAKLEGTDKNDGEPK